MVEDFFRALHDELGFEPRGVILLFLLGSMGAALGSYVAATAYRLRSDNTLGGHRSRCESCARVLRCWENIPVVSYTLLGGRCATCKAPIWPGSFVVELAFTFALPLILLALGPGIEAARAAAALPILVIGSLVDLHERRIPLAVTRALLLAGLLLADPIGLPEIGIQAAAAIGLTIALIGVEGRAAKPFRVAAVVLTPLALLATPTFQIHCVAAVVAYAALAALDWVYTRARKIEVAIGGGDIRLAAGIAAFTGPLGIAPAIFLAAALGSVVGIGGIALGRGSLKAQIPFGPFLATGAFTVLVAGPGLWGMLPGG